MTLTQKLLFKLSLFGLALLALAYWLGWLNTEMTQGQQIISGSYGKGPNIGAVGHLGGVPVVVPPGFAHFVEYDGDPHFMERRKGPRPERTFQSGISSFGFWVRYPDMATATWENREERYVKYLSTTPWMRVGINANSNYGYRGDNSDAMTFFFNNALKSAQNFHQYERLPEKQHELTVYTPKDVDLSRRIVGNPKGRDDFDTNLYNHKAENGKIDTYIKCPNMMRDADKCDHDFILDPSMKVWVSVSYRKGLLPHWRDIQARLTQTLLSFRSTDASPHPSAQKE